MKPEELAVVDEVLKRVLFVGMSIASRFCGECSPGTANVAVKAYDTMFKAPDDI